MKTYSVTRIETRGIFFFSAVLSLLLHNWRLMSTIKPFSMSVVDARVMVVFSISSIALGNDLLMVFHVPVIGADSVIPADNGLMVGSDGCWSWYASGITMLLFSVFRTPHNVIEKRIRVAPMPFCLSNGMKITTALYAQHIHSIFWKKQIYQHGILILKIINLVKNRSKHAIFWQIGT